MIIGVVGAVLVRAHHPSLPSEASTLPQLVPCIAVLAITDEASLAIAGVGIASAWLVEPKVLHPKRRQGALVMLGLLAVVVATNLMAPSTLSVGGASPVQTIELVPA